MAETKLQPDAAARRQPDAVRGAMLRVNTSVMVVLMAVLALALLAVLAGVRASRNLQRAETAEAEAENRLWNAYLAQARAVRAGGAADRRTSALTALSNAAVIRPSLELRNEAIVSLALDELRPRTPLIPVPNDSAAAGFDPTLERYAVGTLSGEIEIFDSTSQQRTATLSALDLGPGTRLSVRSLAFAPNGAWLAARYHGGAVVVWDIATGRVRVAAGVDATTNILGGVLFDGERRRVHFVHPNRGGTIAAFDLNSGREIHHAVEAGTHHFRFHPDGNRVAVANGEDLRVYDYPSGAELTRWTHDSRTVLSAWSPDGRTLAVACQNGDVYLREVSSSKFAILRGHTEACLRLSFNADGSLLATGSRDGTSRIWDVRQKSLVAITDVGVITHFGPNGRDIAVVRPNQGLLTMKLVRGVGLDLVPTLPDAGELLSVDLSPSGKWGIATQNRGFHLLYFGETEADDRTFFMPSTNASSVRILPSETGVFWCREDGLEFRDLPPSNHLAALADRPGRRSTLPGDVGAKAAAIALNERTAIVELQDLRMVVLDLGGSGAPVFLRGNARARYQKSPASPTGSGRFAISPDGRWVAIGFGFGVGTIDRPTVWDAATGEVVAVLTNETGTVAFSPDGRWLGVAGSAAASIFAVPQWDLQSRIPRQEPATTHGSLAWSAECRELVLTATRQQSHLIDRAGNTLAALGAPVPQSLNALRMSQDGRVIVGATVNDLLQVWRLDRLRPELRVLGLDWGSGEDSMDLKPAPSRPTFSTAVLFASGLGFGFVAAFAWVTLRRHRALIEQYIAADQLARERSRDLENARVELLHSQKMKALGTLAAGIAHDFNNLLSVIRMSNKLIGREVPHHPEVSEHVATIEDAVQQGKQVVGSMLGYSRPNPGSDGPKSVDEMVEETVAMLSREFLNGITLTLELDRDLPPVSLGSGKLEQILLNLVVNASEAMQGRGRLRITARRRHDRANASVVLPPATAPRYVEVTIEDSGPGIPAEIRDRIFEPFFTTKHEGHRPGTGLGLSMVYSIAQSEGLGLLLETGSGEGTRFRVWIPAAA
ncbi:MAG: hypothetical protein JNK85_05630 [Verrucomicrobiales bacterium]|nr:hypothetical protein [Verrucomicrobiales bacterium]